MGEKTQNLGFFRRSSGFVSSDEICFVLNVDGLYEEKRCYMKCKCR